MKTKKKKIICVIIIILILIWAIYSTSYIFLQEDFIFFEFFHSKVQSETNTNKFSLEQNGNDNKEIIFEVTYKNTKLQSLNLMETIHNKTLIHEKIAPGTSGNFDIVLKSRQDMDYEIQFESQNEKTSNLLFYVSKEGKRYSSLEELSAELTGNILKNEEKTISIYWEWNYEGSDEKDQKDTIEGKTLREYQFLIYVQGH